MEVLIGILIGLLIGIRGLLLGFRSGLLNLLAFLAGTEGKLILPSDDPGSLSSNFPN